MEMYFCPLFSGSSGNALFCQYGQTRLLIDAGKPGRKIAEALAQIGVAAEQLSGLLVTELVYYSLRLSFILPVIVGVLFTLLHAIIQTYVLIMLTSTYFGEVTEPPKPKLKKKKQAAA